MSSITLNYLYIGGYINKGYGGTYRKDVVLLMDNYEVEKYIIDYNEDTKLFTLFNVPEELQLQMIDSFVFLITYKLKGYKVNVHTNVKNHMTLKVY